MMDVQAYDDETKVSLCLKYSAQKEKIWMTRLVSQGSIACFIP